MFLIDQNYYEVRKTKTRGRGVFAKKEIAERKVLGDYVGWLLPFEEIDFKKEKKNMYLMYYDDNTAIYPYLKKPGVHLLNHSCNPNCFIKIYKRHTIVFTLRKIKKGEELTINYLLPPKDGCINCTHQCFCESIRCTGTMHLSNKIYSKWQKIQEKELKNENRKTHSKRLAPFDKYPSTVSVNYIEELKKKGIITNKL